MWYKNISYEKIWSDFNQFFEEEYHDLCKLKCINGTEEGFNDTNMDSIMQDEISEASNNLSMSKNTEKYVLTQLISTTKQMAKTNKFLMEKIKTLTETNTSLTPNGRNQQKKAYKQLQGMTMNLSWIQQDIAGSIDIKL